MRTMQRQKYPHKEFNEMANPEKMILFALSAAACVITVLAQGVMQETLFANQPWHLRVLNAFLSYMRYVMKTFWPNDLAPMYSQPLDQFPLWQSIAAGVIFLLITIIAVTWARRRPYLFVGWFWFVGTLVPVIGLMQVGIQTMADRYTYIPHIGLLIMLVWGGKEALSTRCSPALTASIASIILLACLISTYLQARLWQNNIALVEKCGCRDIQQTLLAYDCLGISLMAKGRANDALPQFKKAIELEPRYAKARHHLGLVLEEQQKWSEGCGELCCRCSTGTRMMALNHNRNWLSVISSSIKWEEGAGSHVGTRPGATRFSHLPFKLLHGLALPRQAD